MVRRTWRIGALLLLLWSSPAYAEQEIDSDENDPGLFTFISRPDIKATRWVMKTYREDLIAPGYWFVAPYRILDGDKPGKGWVGAHIYDGKGELIWSGKDILSQSNIEDFRISNVRGEYLMTLMDQGADSGVVLDNHYEIREQVPMDHFNSHEFHFVEDGTRALVVKGERKPATREMSKAIGYDGECMVAFDMFQELDVTNNWKPVFSWSTYGHVALEESTLTEGLVEKKCTGTWDYVHANSVDKTVDGDYLYSGRHTDTIYKVSKDDGHIIWRLGGVKSDFPISDELRFTRQHNVRIRGQNETHLMLSILDNAKGIDHTSPPSHEFSRGLLIAVNEKDMTASVELAIDHPGDDVVGNDRYSWRRGNYQLLPNGNIFMGWSEQGVQSEHSPDGTLLFESVFAVKWLGTYRQYKFPFVGEPIDPPDVHSEAIGFHNGTTTTVVHVSWNGATEVSSWDLYRTTPNGEVQMLLASADRSSFETSLAQNVLAGHVLVKAIAKDGKVLGSSGIFKTVLNRNVSKEAIAADKQWVSDNDNSSSSLYHRLRRLFKNPVAAFFIGFACSAVVLLAGYYARQRGVLRFIRTAGYHRLNRSKDDALYEPFTEDEVSEQSLSPQHGRRKRSTDME